MKNTSTRQGDDKSSSAEKDYTSGDKPPGGGNNTPTVEESPAGLTVEGNWEEVTRVCIDFTDKLEQTCPRGIFQDDERIKEWIDWHPREGDNKEELGDKTARQAKFEAEQTAEIHLEESNNNWMSFRENFKNRNLKKAFFQLTAASKKEWGLFYLYRSIHRSNRGIHLQTNSCPHQPLLLR